ncbi:unnamed protein product [Trichogramma brassicae]|uniref:Uncharacterized protein n=1 Tax=Trichogramma brassicae TaxID=86971 RepID=A0A6H5ILF6_9HYME|nr:unnamed protein product [Trichogramma brassicae]
MVYIYSMYISCHRRNIRNFYGCAFDADCKATLLRAQNAEHSAAMYVQFVRRKRRNVRRCAGAGSSSSFYVYFPLKKTSGMSSSSGEYTGCVGSGAKREKVALEQGNGGSRISQEYLRRNECQCKVNAHNENMKKKTPE